MPCLECVLGFVLLTCRDLQFEGLKDYFVFNEICLNSQVLFHPVVSC